MKKSEGFALIETLVVSLVVATIMIYIYVQYTSLQNKYDESFRYNDVDNLYQLNELKEYINSMPNSYKEDILNEIDNHSFYIINKNNNEFTNASDYESNIYDRLKIKTIVITYAEVEDIDTSNLSNNIKNILKRVNNKSANQRIIVEYENSAVATITFKLEVI